MMSNVDLREDLVDNQGMKRLASFGGPALLVAMLFGLASVGGNCDNTTPSTADGGGDSSTPTSDAATGTDAGKASTPVAATCAGVCQCLAAACPDYPFLPDCVTACQDPTNVHAWDLSCRATQCSAAQLDPSTHCPIASGQGACN
jgi:hypothetical protein